MILDNSRKIEIGDKVLFKYTLCNIVGVGLGCYELPEPIVGIVVGIDTKILPQGAEKYFHVYYNDLTIKLPVAYIEGVVVND